IAFILSLAVGFLDGLGLTMFFPLLQVVDEHSSNPDNLGKMKYVIDALQGMGISLTLLNVLLVMILFFTLKGVAKYLSNVYVVLLKQSFIRKIRINLLHKLNRMSFKRFMLSNPGRIQNTMTGEVSRVARAFSAYFKAFQQGFLVMVYMGFAFAVDWQFAILVSLGGGLTNFLYKIIYKHTKGASRKLTRHNNTFQGQIIQHVGHFKYLKATGKVKEYGEHLLKTIFKIEKSRKKIG